MHLKRYLLPSVSPTLRAFHCRSIGNVDLPRDCFYNDEDADSCHDLVPVISGSFEASPLNSLRLLKHFEISGYYGSIKGAGVNLLQVYSCCGSADWHVTCMETHHG